MDKVSKKIIFLDTETTGNDPRKDFLCQLAFKINPDENWADEIFCELFKPPVSIPPEASAVTHITNKMVSDKTSFKESNNYGAIKLMLEDPNAVMVAHNAQFDYEIIKKEGVVPVNTICTLRVARALDKENKIPQYKLQYLRYYLDIDIEASAHDALGDVLVLEKLFERLLSKIMSEDKIDQESAIDKMIKISSTPSLMNMFSFGKHNGKTVAEVAQIDKGYLEWMLAQKEQNGAPDEDWIYTLKHHLGKLA
jgi:DNA polymerase III epsilon subunit-like protein